MKKLIQTIKNIFKKDSHRNIETTFSDLDALNKELLASNAKQLNL